MRAEHTTLVAASLLAGLMLSACRERNPAYVDPTRRDGAVAGDGASEPVLPDAANGEDEEVGDANGADVGPRLDVLPDGVGKDARLDGWLDSAPADTRDGRKNDDVAPDGGKDSSPNADGKKDVASQPDSADGPGPDTSGDVPTPDVPPDTTPECTESTVRACTSPGNPLIGACRSGQQTCTDGAWGPCIGEVNPAETDSCDNDTDDNCDGMTNESCATDCVVVAPAGDDGTADGSAEKPFATIAAALTFATQLDGGAARPVCVAGGATCSDTHTYAMTAALAMPSGARLRGSYALSGTTLTYCATPAEPTTTMAFPTAEQGIVFDEAVAAPTELGAFSIARFTAAGGTPPSGPIAAIAVNGGREVTLARIFVTDEPTGDATYAVIVDKGGRAIVTGSSLSGGKGANTATGIFVKDGTVFLRNNCDRDRLVQGACTSSCSEAGAVLGIRGRAAGAPAGGESSAVYLSPGTTSTALTSTMTANMICGGPASAGGPVKGMTAAALRCEASNCAAIVGNSIGGGTGQAALGLGIAGASPLIDRNAISGGCGTELTVGVLLNGSSARVQNNRIFAGACGTPSSASYVGMRVLLDASSGAQLEVSSNDIDGLGEEAECQGAAVSVEHVDGASAVKGIFRNNILGAGMCKNRVVVAEVENASIKLIENNDFVEGQSPHGTEPVVLFRRGSTSATTIEQVGDLSGTSRNIAADPKFVAYPSDLHLQQGSPCIDQGTGLGAPSTDADAKARPAGKEFDIGAYEAQ